MGTVINIKRTNTILYCKKWHETVTFYKECFDLKPAFSNDWFIEFELSENSYLSVADDKKANIKSGSGVGITISFEVDNIDEIWQAFNGKGLTVEKVKNHPWGGRAFFIYDPEGTRLEIWSTEKNS